MTDAEINSETDYLLARLAKRRQQGDLIYKTINNDQRRRPTAFNDEQHATLGWLISELRQTWRREIKQANGNGQLEDTVAQLEARIAALETTIENLVERISLLEFPNQKMFKPRKKSRSNHAS
jgi:hypothetical protein